MEATLYLISGSYVSARRANTLIARLEAMAPGLARAIRLESDGAGLWAALDALRDQGAATITLRPVGLPFSQSLERWLPGAAASWLDRQPAPAPALRIAGSVEDCPTTLAAAARADVPVYDIAPQRDGHIGKGWDDVPPMRHHLLVCAGPRCHLRDAPALADVLKTELGRAGIADECLITTTGCAFPCNRGPVVVHYPAGDWYRLPDSAAVRRFAGALASGKRLTEFHFHTTGDPAHETS